jgi:hypothetical protein
VDLAGGGNVNADVVLVQRESKYVFLSMGCDV